MANPISLQDNEVSLGGYRFPITGRVQITKSTIFPSKITIGKTSRSDQLLADEWIMNDWRGGILVDQLDEQIHEARFNWSTLNTWTTRKMMLAPEVVDINVPTSETHEPDMTFTFLDKLYASFGGFMYYWYKDGTTGAEEWRQCVDGLSVPINLGGPPKRPTAYQGRLYIPMGTTYWHTNGVADWQQVSEKAIAFCTFDVNPSTKLLKLDADGLVKASANGTTWVTEVGGQIYDATPTDIISFRSSQDEPLIIVVTTTGLVALDPWTKTSYPTACQINSNSKAGLGTTIWNDGQIYYPDSLALWRYPRSGQIANVGLDREDGLPTFIRGNIVQTVGLPNYLATLIDFTSVYGSPAPEELFFAPDVGIMYFPAVDRAGYSAILIYSGDGWHCFFLSEATSTGIKSATYSTGYNSKRIFFIDNKKIKYSTLLEGNYDPSTDPNARFRLYGEFSSGWFDANFSEMTKLAARLKLRAMNITSTETIEVYYTLNDKSDDWQYLGKMDDTTTDSRGNAIFRFNHPEGVHFYSIKFKFIFRSGSNTKTPVLLFSDLRYKRQPAIQWGWTFTITSDNISHLQNVWSTIKTLTNARKTMLFAFRAEEEEEHVVEIINLSGIRYTNNTPDSSFSVTVVELESEE